mgnify:CR=1 FL=1|jgi:hypothetical protein
MGEAYLVPGSVKNKPMIIHQEGFSYNTRHIESIPVSQTGYYVAQHNQVMKTYSYSGDIVAVEVDTVGCTAKIYYSYDRTCNLFCTDFSQHKVYYPSTTYDSFLRWDFQTGGSGMSGNSAYYFKCILSGSMMTLYGTNTIYEDNVCSGTINIQIYTVE